MDTTENKKGLDILGFVLWIAIILAWAVILLVPATRDGFIAFTGAHKYLGGFIEFAILATMGDLLAGRITTGKWKFNVTTIFRALIWGFIGMAIKLFFGIFSYGVLQMQAGGLLPFPSPATGNVDFAHSLVHAFFTSLLMNLTFGPAMFIFHKFTDTFIDAKYTKKPANVTALIERIDWKTFFTFTVFTTVPAFWVPCHTIVFILPPDYQVLMAAFLSIALGLLLSLRKKAASKAE